MEVEWAVHGICQLTRVWKLTGLLAMFFFLAFVSGKFEKCIQKGGASMKSLNGNELIFNTGHTGFLGPLLTLGGRVKEAKELGWSFPFLFPLCPVFAMTFENKTVPL